MYPVKLFSLCALSFPYIDSISCTPISLLGYAIKLRRLCASMFGSYYLLYYGVINIMILSDVKSWPTPWDDFHLGWIIISFTPQHLDFFCMTVFPSPPGLWGSIWKRYDGETNGSLMHKEHTMFSGKYHSLGRFCNTTEHFCAVPNKHKDTISLPPPRFPRCTQHQQREMPIKLDLRHCIHLSNNYASSFSLKNVHIWSQTWTVNVLYGSL